MDEDEIAARLNAHRAITMALAMVLNETDNGAFARFIEAVSTFEQGFRQQNEPTAAIDEIRNFRETLEAMKDVVPQGTPAPRADSEPS